MAHCGCCSRNFKEGGRDRGPSVQAANYGFIGRIRPEFQHERGKTPNYRKLPKRERGFRDSAT